MALSTSCLDDISRNHEKQEKSTRQDSNLQPEDLESLVLPIELRVLVPFQDLFPGHRAVPCPLH